VPLKTHYMSFLGPFFSCKMTQRTVTVLKDDG